jgi:hypothetical protein
MPNCHCRLSELHYAAVRAQWSHGSPVLCRDRFPCRALRRQVYLVAVRLHSFFALSLSFDVDQQPL